MNVAYLKVMHGLRFHLFFFFLFFFGTVLLLSFHGRRQVVHQLWSFAFSRKHEVRVVAGENVGMARHVSFSFFFFFFFLEQLGWCPPGSWCPTETAYSAYRERRHWRNVFIVQCRSHNISARLKSVMMFFGNVNVLCSFWITEEM